MLAAFTDGPQGSISGAPSVELISAGLARWAPDKRSRPAWRRGLAVAPGVGLEFLPKLACPACWPAYTALVSSLGLSFCCPHGATVVER